MNVWQIVLAVFVGIGLSAACGFRIFVPLLIASIASRAGAVSLGPGFEWIASNPAIITFGIATVLEIAAYYVPWLDNLLDTIATPAATVAGVLVTAAFISDMSPLLRWAIAVIAGGGVALTVQSMTVAVRAGSSGFTGGLGNPVVSTGEAVSSGFMSVLAVFVPVVAVALVVVILFFAVRHAVRIIRRRRARLSAVHPEPNERG